VTPGSAALIRFATIRSLNRLIVPVAVLCVGVFAPAWVSTVRGEPLPKERCAELAAELSLLEGGGAAENIQRGPEWAKANLTPEQMGYVRRLIAVREDLLFRCRNFAPDEEAPLPSSAPATAPLPVRKPAAPEGGNRSVPMPARPEHVEAKLQGRPANNGKAGDGKDGMSAVSGPKPKLRGTFPPKGVSAAVPAPERKTKPVPSPAAGN